MRISSKLVGLSLGTVVVVAGLAITLVGELKAVSTGYNNLLQGPVREAEAARVAQVDFKKQVQEWKDILLRGHNPDDLEKYTRQFHAQEAKVKAEAQTLSGLVDDPVAKQLLGDFLVADETLSAKYQAAYDVYLKGKFDFKAADKLVRGQDRPPTDLFDKVVVQLNTQLANSVAAQQAAAVRQRNMALAISCMLLALISLTGFIVVRSVLTRLGRLKAISDRLAKAEIDGLSIDISGKDEVGEFGNSLKGVAAAIRELLGIASQQ
jgi:methyl-accepting chemotaxis protein